MVPVVATTGGTSSGSGNTLVAQTARRDPGRCRPWPSYGVGHSHAECLGRPIADGSAVGVDETMAWPSY